MWIIITFRELRDKYNWEKVCDVLGLDLWCVAEGLASDDDEITISEGDARKMGIL